MCRFPARTAAFVVVGGALMWFAASNVSSLRAAGDGIATLALVPAVLGLALSGTAICNRGQLNVVAHRAVGLTPSAGEMTRTAAMGFAATKVVKSAGLSGLAVFVRDGRRRGHPAASVTAACGLAAAASFAALGVLMAATVAVLAVTAKLSSWWLVAGCGYAAGAVAIGITGVAVVRRPGALVWISDRLPRRRRRSRSSQESSADAVIASVHAVGAAMRDGRSRRRLLVHAVGSKVLGVVMLQTAVAAVGIGVGVPAIVVIYTTALAAACASLIPGGVGVVEASMSTMLIARGVRPGAALTAVALFRIFDMWIPLSVGLVCARRQLRRDDPEVAAEAEPIALDADDPAVLVTMA
jgi:uncharacterized membrane protein YbhN (UPF0104 family)